MTDLEEDILAMLSHGAETARLLVPNVELEDGGPTPSEKEVREALGGLQRRGLVRSYTGIDPFDPAPSARATWWVLTAEGAELAAQL